MLKGMQYRLLLVLLFVFAGCQPKSDSSDAHSASDADSESKVGAPAVRQEGEVLVVQMTGNDRMRFNLETFTVRAGQTVRLHLTNIGKRPKISMAHNVVILQPDTNVNAFAADAALEKDSEYIPAAYAEQIIAHTAMLGPGDTDAIEFVAPEVPGEYPFVCSFPAHVFAGMKGMMVVESDSAQPIRD